MPYPHHPNVERWRPYVEALFGAAGFGNEIEYAMMVMWGESAGRTEAVGPALASGARAHGLFQHLDPHWTARVSEAKQYWRSHGVTIGDDPYDPWTNIAVAAWLRWKGGWGHWAVTYDWYREGTWGPNTYWDGYEYRNLMIPSNSTPPRGDGQIGSGQFSGGLGFGQQSAYPYFVHPLPGVEPSGHFGDDRWNDDGSWRPHQGVDFSATEGTPMRAAAAGRVVFAGHRNSSAGYAVILDHGNGWLSKYFHVQEGGLLVNVGDTVAQGQHIALVGATGNAEGPHLHFEIEANGEHIDPILTGIVGNLDPSTIGGFGFSPQQPPETSHSRARSVLGTTLDAISRAVAGGQRVPWGAEAPALELDSPDDPGQPETGEDSDEPDLLDPEVSLGQSAAQLGEAAGQVAAATQQVGRGPM